MKTTLLSIFILLLTACEERGINVPSSNTRFTAKKASTKVSTLKPSIKVLPMDMDKDISDEKPLDKSETKKEKIKLATKTTTKSKKEKILLDQKKTENKAIAVKIVKPLKKASSKQKKSIVKSDIKPSTKSPLVNNTKAKKILVTKKSKPKSESLFKNFPTFGNVSFENIPILNKVIPAPSKISQKRVKKQSTVQGSLSQKSTTKSSDVPSSNRFVGGKDSHSLDMGMIRIGKSNDYTSIILESYKWNRYQTIPAEISPVSGSYEFNYEPEANRIVAVVNGYNAFSALVGDQSELFKDNDIVKTMYIDRYVGKDGIKFIIELTKKVKMSVIDVQNPGRIIVNLYPL